jgi:hypothetical protein
MALVAAGLLALSVTSVWQEDVARAAPKCNVPDPPPICERGPVDPPPPPPPAPLAPDIGGSSEDTNTWFGVAVSPHVEDYQTLSRLVIERAPSPSGPWSSWRDQALSPWLPGPSPELGRRFTLSGEVYQAPLPPTCFRAKVATSTGGFSPWSVVKCLTSGALATNVSVPRYSISGVVPVTWTDNSVNDQTYYIRARGEDGRTWVTSVPGTPGSTGTLSAVITGADSGTTCVTVWARDRLPGDTQSFTNAWIFWPQTPMVPAINPSAPACFTVPYV